MTDQHMNRAVDALERIALALAAICADQMENEDQPAKAKRLSHLGFSNVQIASALGTTSNSINVALHRARKKRAGVKRRARRRKTK